MGIKENTMTDEPIEGKIDNGGEPTPSAPSQPSEADLAKQIDLIQKQLSALQSGKDKRWETEVKPMKDEIKKLAEYLGVDEAQVHKAKREMALDELASAYNDAPPESAGAEEGVSQELKAIEAVLELPANDPRVTDLKLKYPNDPVGFGKEGLKLKQALATAQISPAENIMPDGSPKTEVVETDAQRMERVMGGGPGFFDLDNVRKQGGGVVIHK